jgi:hypothetical protein
MTKTKITISPGTKVGELLDAYPELEPVLMAMSPAFEKLRNPVLRKTVARIASLQQVAVVGGVNIDEMIRRLRKEAGESYDESTSANPEYQATETPEWFEESMIKVRYDATTKINSGESPMNEILHQTSQLKPGEIFELQTPFIPAPIIDMLRAKEFRIFTIVNNDRTITYISR